MKGSQINENTLILFPFQVSSYHARILNPYFNFSKWQIGNVCITFVFQCLLRGQLFKTCTNYTEEEADVEANDTCTRSFWIHPTSCRVIFTIACVNGLLEKTLRRQAERGEATIGGKYVLNNAICSNTYYKHSIGLKYRKVDS